MTELGIVGHGPVRAVGPAGAISSLDGRQLFDWWIGADDRWHHASVEPAVRQARGADDITIETRLRIPGGDAVQRLAAVPDAGISVMRVEIENDTPVPVAVALVYQCSRGAVRVYDNSVTVDGTTVLRAGRSVARVLVADDVASARQRVEAGDALPPAEIEWPVPGSVVVAIFPLPHTATFRCAVGGADATVTSPPDDLPPIDAVARGWATHVARAAEVVVPDDRVRGVAEMARRHLLVGSGLEVSDPFWTADVEPWVPAVSAAALDAWGHHVEARELLIAATGIDDLMIHAARGMAESGALLWAWAERLERRSEPELEAVLAPWVEQVAMGLVRRPGKLARRRLEPGDEQWRAVGLAAAGSLLTRLGNDTVGPDIVDALPDLVGDMGQTASLTGSVALSLGGRRLGQTTPPLAELLREPDGRPTGDGPLGDLAATATSTGAIRHGTRAQHPAWSAMFLHALRRAVVDEPEGTGGRVALLQSPDHRWLGGSIEVHRVPLTGGAASFGIRWHADRPALLWDLTPTRTPRVLSAPALDAHWRDDRAQGEALLAHTEHFTVAPGPMSAEVRRGDPIGVDDEPDSFA